MLFRLVMKLSVAFFMFPAFASAQSTPGTVTGTIGSLTITAQVWSEQSDFYGDGNAGGVSIMTRPVAPEDGLGAISIGFEGSDYMGNDLSSFEINIRDNAAENMSDYNGDLDQDIQISISRAEKQGGTLSIAGTIKRTLIWRQLMPISERKEDPARLLPVDLVFDAILDNEY